MYRVIDVHVHDPYIYEVNKRVPSIVAEELLQLMDKYDIEYIFLYALEADPLKPPKNISKKKIYRGIEDAVNKGIYVLPSVIMDSIENYENTIYDHVHTLKTVYTPTERIVKISRYSNNRIYPVGNIRFTKDREEDLERLKGLIRLGIKGLKIYPTIQFLKPSDKTLYPIYSILEKNKIPLFIHTGCDPGLWELPSFCESADPINIVDIAERFPNLEIILCHTGAYSALRPGIFLDNALKLIRKYENVYGDLAAVEPDIVKYIVSKTDYKKILFGSDYPVTGREWGSLISNVTLLDIPNEIKESILYYNAKEIFNI